MIGNLSRGMCFKNTVKTNDKKLGVVKRCVIGMLTFVSEMNEQILAAIAKAWNWRFPQLTPIQSGLINRTWKVSEQGQSWLLQAINTHVFPQPDWIAFNLQLLSRYLTQHHPNYLFTSPVVSESGKGIFEWEGSVYRVFPWIPGSHSRNALDDANQAFEAARCFGAFTKNLCAFPAAELKVIIPGFHDLSLRYHQFEQALQNGNSNRLQECSAAIQFLQAAFPIVTKYESYTRHSDVKHRVTHHDTKISNVLFNEQEQGMCVIDLDTVMSGYFISDTGDMFRTYVCAVTEEEQQLDLITVRKEYTDAIVAGYLSEMGSELSSFEQDHIYFGGEVLMYMQALRFLADYLQMDKYYGARYPTQNKVRAENQIRLLTLFQESLR